MNRVSITAAIHNPAVLPGTYGRASLLLCVSACLVGMLLLSMPQVARANKKSSALPEAVFAAKTIYIDNQTNAAELHNDAYMGLAKWGHFELVDSAQKADLVLRLTGTSFAQTIPSDTPPDMSVKTGSTHAGGDAVLPNGGAAAPDGFTRLTLVDPKSGAALWSDLSKTNRPEAAARIVDVLREAFEQGLKARGK